MSSRPRAFWNVVLRAARATACRLSIDDFRFESIDPKVREATGITDDEWRSPEFWTTRLHPDDRSVIAEAQQAARNGRDVYTTFRISTGDGHLRLHLCAQPVPDSHPPAIDGFLIADPLSLLETDELARAVLASFPGYVAVLDGRGFVLAVNHAWATLHTMGGLSSIAASGVGESYLEALRLAVARGQSESQGVFDAVVSVLHGDTERARLEYSCNVPERRSLVLLVQHLKRRAGGVVVTHLDVTERAHSMQALQEARQGLMRASQLAVAGELVGAIGHDLRQPLTALQMDLAVVMHLLRQPTPDVAGVLTALEDCLGDQERVIESLQVLQDLVSQHAPRRDEVALNAIALEVARLVGSEALARHVSIEVQLAKQLPTMLGDGALVRQALLSAVLEAIEIAASRTEAVGSVLLATGQPDEEHVELTVTHPTQREPPDPANRRWALSVARSVTEAHQSTLSVDEDAQGTTIRMTWPTFRNGHADATGGER